MPVEVRWRPNPACHLLWRQWQSPDCILYNIASGQTHFLNELGACTLRLLQDHPAPLTSSEICHQLSTQCGLPLDQALQDYTEQMLANMDELGLIEPCRP